MSEPTPKKMTITLYLAPADDDEALHAIDPDFVEDEVGFPINYVRTEADGYEVWKGETSDPNKIKDAMDALSDWFDWDNGPTTTEGDSDIYDGDLGDDSWSVALEY